VIERDDLRAAVSAGIVSEGQAASLSSLAHSRQGARENLAPGDEPFELFKGFNEIFIVIGLLILAVGWAGVNGFAMSNEITNPQQAAVSLGLIGTAILWLLSEYFIRRRRMVGPAIALSILFAGNAAVALVAYFAEPFMLAQEDCRAFHRRDPIGRQRKWDARDLRRYVLAFCRWSICLDHSRTRRYRLHRCDDL